MNVQQGLQYFDLALKVHCFSFCMLSKKPPDKKHEGPNQMNYEKKLFFTG